MIRLSDPAAARGVRSAAQGSGWSARAGTLSIRRGGIAFHVYDFAGWLRFKAKPAEWDRILWGIIGVSFRKRPRPTRHFWGVACPSPVLEIMSLDGVEAARAGAAALNFAESAVLAWSADAIRQAAFAARHPPDRDSDFVITETVALLEEGRREEAHAIAQEVVAGRRRCSFNVGAFGSAGARGRFFQALLEGA